MIAYILKDRASGLFCAGIESARRAILVTHEIDHAEAWATEVQAKAAAAALAGVGGVFAWAVDERQGDVATRLLGRLMTGARPEARGVLDAGELSEGQYAGVCELVRLLNASQRHIDRQVGVLGAAGIAFDDRPFTALYDRLWNMAEPFQELILAHMGAVVGV